MSELVFDSLEPVEVPVKLAGRDFLLVEASEASAARYRNFAARQVRFGADGKVAALGDVADAQALLVSLCLWEMKGQDGSPTRFPVSEATIRGWRSQVVQRLFEEAKRISGIDQETEEAIAKRIEADTARLAELRAGKNGHASVEGNSPASTTTTSTSPTS